MNYRIFFLAAIVFAGNLIIAMELPHQNKARGTLPDNLVRIAFQSSANEETNKAMAEHINYRIDDFVQQYPHVSREKIAEKVVAEFPGQSEQCVKVYTYTVDEFLAMISELPRDFLEEVVLKQQFLNLSPDTIKEISDRCQDRIKKVGDTSIVAARNKQSVEKKIKQLFAGHDSPVGDRAVRPYQYPFDQACLQVHHRRFGSPSTISYFTLAAFDCYANSDAPSKLLSSKPLWFVTGRESWTMQILVVKAARIFSENRLWKIEAFFKSVQ